MYKETIFSIIIIIIVVVGNIVTQNYTNYSVKKATSELEKLKQELSTETEKINWNEVENKFANMQKEWRKEFEKLAYYTEHDELEKVDTNLTGLRSYIETKEEIEAINELEKSVFILKHIEDKTRMNLKNIF